MYTLIWLKMNKITTMVAIMSAAILAAGIGLNTMATPAYALTLSDSNICTGDEGDDVLGCVHLHQGSGDDVLGDVLIGLERSTPRPE